ncbi:MAG: S8 family serine peptidase [Saccharofermentanales bacterium]
MKKILIAILMFLIIFLLCITLAHFMLKDYGPVSSQAVVYSSEADQPYRSELPAEENIIVDPVSGRKFLKGEILLFSKKNTTKQQVEDLISRYNGEIIEHLEEMQLYRISFSDYEDYASIDKLLTVLNSSNFFEIVNLNEVIEYETKFLIPDDPWYEDETVKEEWTEKPRGRNWGVEAIRAPQAWAKIDNDTKASLGIIDSSLENNSADLKEVVHLEQAVTDNKSSTSDHGMHVAGTMAATFNNKKAISGICTNNKLISGKLNSTTFGILALINKMVVDEKVKAINYSAGFGYELIFAAQKGVTKAMDVINSAQSQAETGLKNLVDNGYDFLLCVAAGNTSNEQFFKDESSEYGYTWYNKWDIPPQYNSQELESILSDAKWSNQFAGINNENVRSRIVVVGSVGLDQNSGLFYSSFSEVGERVDVVAPGERVYSLSWDGKIVPKDGTSMAAPHVSGLAGLLLQLNPDLTGPQLKNIIINTATGDYKYDATHGKPLIQADAAADIALNTDSDENIPIISGKKAGLDLCFVIDTTRSMEDDIADVKDSISDIITAVQNKSENYRIAFVSYRDFPERTGDTADYPSKILMPFTNNAGVISQSLDEVGLGYGGDDPETVFSGLMTACRMNWRDNSSRFIILMGDAPALDPEPNTNYTYDDILNVLKTNSISIDQEHSTVDTVLPDQNFWSVYSIVIGDNEEALDFLKNLAEDTGGSYTKVLESSEVSGAIIETVDSFEIKENIATTLMLDKGLSGYSVSVIDGQGNYIASAPISDEGKVQFDNLSSNSYYHWQCGMAKGTISISETGGVINMSTSGVILTTIIKYISNTFIYILLAVIVVLLITLLVVVLSLLKKRSLIKFAYPKKSDRRQLVKDYNIKILTEKRVKKDKKQLKKDKKHQQKGVNQAVGHYNNPQTVHQSGSSSDTGKQNVSKAVQQFQLDQEANKRRIHFCGNCGNKVDANDEYCRTCGEIIK